jgi:flagellar biosynthesis chaperone FliJ
LQDSGNAVSRAQESEQSLESEQAKVLAEISECKELMANTWTSLKNATFPGQQWRERNKTIDLLMQALDKMGLDVSLKAALPTALKTKPSERGRFASKAVEFAEVHMSGYLSSLTEKVENSNLEAVSRAQVTATALENRSAAEQQLEGGKTAAAVAQEQLTHALAAQKAIEVELQAAPRKLQKLSSTLEKQELSLAHIEAVLSTFLSLKERSKPAEEIPSPCQHAAAEVLAGESLLTAEAQ